jgi:hypothetical protein
METPQYQQAFARIRAEYADLPGMRLTPAQVHRLSGVEISICKLVLDDLLRARFLAVGPDGSYIKESDEGRPRMTGYDRNPDHQNRAPAMTGHAPLPDATTRRAGGVLPRDGDGRTPQDLLQFRVAPGEG